MKKIPYPFCMHDKVSLRQKVMWLPHPDDAIQSENISLWGAGSLRLAGGHHV